MDPSLRQKMNTLSNTVPWNIALLTIGVTLCGFAIKSLIMPAQLITGGITGVGLLLYYNLGGLSPGFWYLVLNVPVFAVGWVLVSRRFFFYSLYGTAAFTVAIDVINVEYLLPDPFLAVIAGGVIAGAGAGIIFRSLGSAGGLDIIAIILNQRYNIPVGQFGLAFNLLLFIVSASTLEVAAIIYSLTYIFIAAWVTDRTLTMFNRRKMVMAISTRAVAICDAIGDKIKRGSTIINVQGGYGGHNSEPRQMVLTIVSNLQLRRVERLILDVDPDAFIVIEDTYNVLGRGFSLPRQY